MRILSGKRLYAMMAILGLLQGAACSNGDNETPEASADAGSVSADTGSTSADSGSVTADTGSTSTDTGATSADTGSAAADTGSTIALFSFFVTSLAAMQELSGSPDGFGGDLRFGETGPGAGLRGADKICRAIAEKSMPGAAAKQWRAFLSVTADENGNQVNAIDRIGNGPWYDRIGRLLAPTKGDLLRNRPQRGDVTIQNDFPNEDGVPNHQPNPAQDPVDNHDFLTGTNAQGMLHGPTATCNDWTSATGAASEGRPRVGHSWPRSGTAQVSVPDGGRGPVGPDGGMLIPPRLPDGGFPLFPDSGLPTTGGSFGDPSNWMSALDESGCRAGINLSDTSVPDQNNNTVGWGGGYGGIYCFALTP